MKLHHVPCAVALSSLVVATLGAQAPVVTERGDPSVRNDSIYSLASTTTAYPDQSTLVLLDDGIVRLEADGRAVRTYRQVIQILQDNAVERFQEHSYTWIPGRQTLRINWARVVRPNGEVVSAQPSQVQDADVPAEMSDPVYSDEKVRRFSLSGVAVGTLVDISFTIEDVKPFPPNDVYGSWSVSMGSAVRRSRLIVDAPASTPLTIVEKNLDFKRRETTAGNRRVYTWARADVQRVKPEAYAADSNAVYMHLAYALPRTWDDIGHWYGSLAKDRMVVGPATRQRLPEIVAGAKTLEDSLRALHRWVAQDIRYVSVDLDQGGYRPRLPDTVVTTGFGDCKDKATLFVAVARSWGVRAEPVILRTSHVDRRLPSVQQFNHAIAAIEQPGGGYRYVDLTASTTPWGELPYGPQGEFALVVRADGRVDQVTLPKAPIAENHSMTRVAGTLSPQGIFAGRFEETGAGILQYSLRGMFETPLDSTKRAEVKRSLAAKLFPGAVGDSLETFNGKDLRATPRLALSLHGGRAAAASGGMMVLSLPMGNMEVMESIAEQFEAQGPRRFTIDAEEVLGPVTRETEVRFTLPDGWKARLPQGVDAVSDFGEFHSSYAQEGRDLVIRRRVVGRRGIYAPERATDLVAWMRESAKENTRFVMLDPGPAAAGGMTAGKQP